MIECYTQLVLRFALMSDIVLDAVPPARASSSAAFFLPLADRSYTYESGALVTSRNSSLVGCRR